MADKSGGINKPSGQPGQLPGQSGQTHPGQQYPPSGYGAFLPSGGYMPHPAPGMPYPPPGYILYPLPGYMPYPPPGYMPPPPPQPDLVSERRRLQEELDRRAEAIREQSEIQRQGGLPSVKPIPYLSIADEVMLMRHFTDLHAKLQDQEETIRGFVLPWTVKPAVPTGTPAASKTPARPTTPPHVLSKMYGAKKVPASNDTKNSPGAGDSASTQAKPAQAQAGQAKPAQVQKQAGQANPVQVQKLAGDDLEVDLSKVPLDDLKKELKRRQDEVRKRQATVKEEAE